MASARAGRVVSVGGGQGVGKSAVASNLAVALAQGGARVVLVDADLGAASLHALFGVARPWPGVPEFLEGALPDLAAGVVETGVPGLRLVPGHGAVVGAGDSTGAGPRGLLRQVRTLDADLVVVDVGAAAAPEVQDCFDGADLRLVVMTPQLSAAQVAYAWVRAALLRELRRIAAVGGQLARLDEAVERAEPSSTTAQLLASLAGEAGLAASLQAGLSGFGVRLVGNQIFEARETNLIYALSRMAKDFLGLEAPVLGSLRNSWRLRDAASGPRPYLLQPDVDGDECAVTFRTMARALRSAPLPRPAPAAHGDGQAAPPPSRAPAPPPALPPALPVDVAAYERAYERHLVDLPATLVHPGGRLPVRVKDVSEGGALLELDGPPAVGTRVTLVVPDLGEHPGLSCLVRHAEPAKRRAGVQFQGGRDEGRRAIDAIRRAGATSS